MAMKGGVGAGGSGGDEAWARVGDVNGNGNGDGNGNGNGDGNGNRNGNEVSIPVPLPVLMALCEEAGWTVEADGTIYRKGPKPRASKSDVLLPPWATGAGASGFSFQTSTPPLMSTVTSGRTPGPDPVTLMTDFQISTGTAANKAPAYSSFVASGASSLSAESSASASAWMLPPLPRQSSRHGGALLSPLRFSEQASAREDADEEEGMEPNLGNAETHKDRA